eukprot:scpid96146/ scgid6500/ 
MVMASKYMPPDQAVAQGISNQNALYRGESMKCTKCKQNIFDKIIKHSNLRTTMLKRTGTEAAEGHTPTLSSAYIIQHTKTSSIQHGYTEGNTSIPSTLLATMLRVKYMYM